MQLELAGLPVLVSDTAGIREAAADAVEAEGIRRAKEAAGQAQLTLMVLDAATALGPDELRSLAGVGPFGVDAPPDDLVAVAAAVKADPGLLLVVNKLDAVAGSRAAALVEGLRAEESASTSAFLVSCATGEGVEGLLGGLQARLQAAFDREGGDGQGAEIPVITRARHRVHVERCAAALTAFLEDKSLGLDTAAEELRIASRELGRITGAVDVEEVLDEIFTAFCVGK